MASSSPYQNNDYQAVSTYRPYQLPINDIFKAISAQNQFWDEGARRVKSVYDNALGLDLTLEENRMVRDEYMKKAEKEITKLSSKDLSDPSVQREGFDIFKPLLKDSAIIQDDYLTNKQKSIFMEAEQYKRKGNGEGFHPDNLAYAMMPFKGFGSKTSRQQVGEIFERSKNAQYVPFHDVSKEYLDVASKCKPDEYSSNSVQGLYFRSSEDSSNTAANIMGCIKAGISDKAWNQIKMTGTVRYGDNIGAVAKGFAPIIIGDNNANAQRLLEISAERKKLKDAGSLNPEMDEAYNAEIGNINKSIIENTGVLQRIARNDYSDIAKNYENVVSQVYANQDIGGFAAAYAYRKHKEEWKTNPAGIAQYTQGNINARQAQMLQNQNFWKGKDLEIDQAKLQMEQNKNDIDLMKSLMGDSKSLTGAGGADYQMLLPIMQRLGIDPGVTLEMPISEKVEGVGITAEKIREQAERFHHDRVSAATGMYNILKRVVGKDNVEALNKEVYNAQGILNSDAIYKKADTYLNTYHNTPGTANSDDIIALENSANEYSAASAKVMNWMKARDEVTSRLAKGESPKNVLQSVGDILQSKLQYGLGNIPGLSQSIRKEFTGSLPQFQGDDYEFRPGKGYQDENGNFVTEVQVFHSTKEKGDDEVTRNVDRNATAEVIEALSANGYSMNDMNTIIYDKDKGTLKVKTPYLPMAQKDYELKSEVNNHIWMNRNIPIANQDNFSIPLRHIPGTGGFKTGFDIIGNGTDYNTKSQKPRTYRAWYMTPDGSKEYYGQETPLENILSNQLSLLEKNAQRLAEGYRAAAKKKK